MAHLISFRSTRRTAPLAVAGTVAMLLASASHAAPGPITGPLVSACSGVSLPPSVVTGILAPVITGTAVPTEAAVNALIAGVSTGLGIVPGILPAPLSFNASGLLANAAAGAPINLAVLKTDGTVFGPTDQCNATSNSVTTGQIALTTPAGIALGGNMLTGLGSGTPAAAGEVNSIALGNGATTTPGATTSVALGNGASVTAPNSVALGAGSTATRGAANGSAGEVSVGAPGATRQITNVAAGTAPTDAVNLGQVTASANAAPIQYSAAGAPTTPTPGVVSNDTTLVGAAAGTPVALHNVAAGTLTPTSTDAVNGSQLAATNAAVAGNTTNIAGNSTTITNLAAGTAGPVQRTGLPNSLALVAPGATGAAAGVPQSLGNVAAGAAPTDAVNFGQLTATNANVTTNTTNLANLSTGITNGTVGLVQQTGGSPGAGAITIGAATGGTTITVAGTGGNRVISGVAAGVAPTDAANVGQLTGAIGTATANAVQYDTAAGTRTNRVTLAGGAAGPVTVTNVAAGALTPASTDAVNGSQLAATNTTVAGNTTAITNLTNGTAGLVQQATPTGPVTVAAGTGGTTVDFTGTGGTRTLSGVGAGVAATDAVNLGQTTALIAATAGASPIQYSAAAAPTTPTPGVVSNSTTLVGTAAGTPVALHNVAAGAVTTTSTDAVNGSQLAATNAQTATNTTNIAGNTTAITNLTNGTAGLVQQTGGAPGTGQLTVGAATGGTSVTIAGTGGNRTLTGLNAGLAGNDAVTVAQVNGLTGNGLNNVQYDPTAAGGRSNTITLAGGVPGPVALTNVAPAALTPTSTGAVNGSQLAATNTQVASLTLGQAGAFQSNNAAAAPPPVATGANASAGGFGASATGAGGVALGNGATSTGTGSVALGQGSTDGGASRVVSVGGVGSERRVTNVGPALNGTDAVNLSQLQTATTSFGATTTGLQNQLNQTNFDLGQVRRRANGGTAGAMAVAGLPQAFEPGKSMIGGAVGYWADQVAFAIGVSSIVGEHTVVKAGGSISNQGVGGFNAGIGFQF